MTIPSSLAMNNDLHYQTAVDQQRSIVSRFQYLSWGEFSGSLQISVASGQAWEILFYQGQIVWSLDCDRPNRFWYRQIRAYLDYRHLGLELLFQAAEHVQPRVFALNSNVCWQYQGLISLVMLAEITVAEAMAVLTTGAQEVIFDLLQYSQGQKLTFRSQPEMFVDRPSILVNTEQVLERAELMWQEWHTQRLGDISPNKTPAIAHPVQLYRQTTPIIYQNLVQVITGKRTLREISAEINEDLLLLTRSLTRYIQTGIIELLDLPDLKTPQVGSKVLADPPLIAIKPKKTAPMPSKLVTCIDDSPQVCELMRSIVTEAGYRFIAIQDATQALPRLLENKPDLIFLDLMMPKINGYEICGQIKRISSFSQTPVIILTGKDGLLDRVRAKIVGSSEFISKPISKGSIDTILAKWLVASG
jgi:two-component system, chemotaxis family, response regulator PixG